MSASGPRTWRDQVVFEAESKLADAVLAEIEAGASVLVVPVGRAAEFSVAPAIALDLVEAGHRIGVPPSQESGYGMHLVADGDYDAALVVVSGAGGAQEWPGTVVASVDLNAASARARATLADQLRGRDLEVSATADEVLADLVGSSDSGTAAIFATYMESLVDDPESVLLHPLAGRALAAGYFEGLELDGDAVQTLVDNPPVEVWNDDVIEVRLLAPDQIDQHRDALMAVGIGRPVQN